MVARGQGWAISTPFSLLNARLPLEGLDLRRLPPPIFSRHIALAAKAGRIGALPRELAALCRGVIAGEVATRLAGLSAEIAEDVLVTP